MGQVFKEMFESISWGPMGQAFKEEPGQGWSDSMTGFEQVRLAQAAQPDIRRGQAGSADLRRDWWSGGNNF